MDRSADTTVNRVTVNQPERRAGAGQSRRRRAASHPVGDALQLLGDRWTLLILRDAFGAGHRRYAQWREQLTISDAVLTGRLRDLVDGGVFELVRYEDRPPRSEYRLTERGLDLWRVLLSMWAWESRWVEASPEAALALRHLACRKDVVPHLACEACGAAVTLRDIRTDVTASGWAWLHAPTAKRRRSRGTDDGGALREETMAILGDRWSSTLLALAFLGVRRFSEFERNVEVSPTVLSQRLRSLTELGVLDVAPVSDGGRRKEYRLTEKGLAFFPTVALVLDWADRWFGDGRGSSLSITHLGCGEVLRPTLGCGRCGELLERDGVAFHARPVRRGRALAGSAPPPGRRPSPAR